MVLATNLGFPRIGAKRELKKALESFWKGEISEAGLKEAGAELRARHWKLQKDAGLAHIPSNEFSFYDHVLDLSATLGVVPERYNFSGGNVDTKTYFAMARGNATTTACEMTKWFDTNYHYIVPELVEGQSFKLSSRKIIDEYKEAKAQGIDTRPVLVGPITYLKLAKKAASSKGDWCRCTLVPGIVAVYAEILKELKAAGAEWVQIDEPYLALDLEDRYKDAYKSAYKLLQASGHGCKIIVATYFESLRDNTALACELPVDALHVDLVRGKNQLGDVLAKFPADKILSCGVVDGRNIWKTDLRKATALVQQAVDALGTDRVWVAPSCAMIHSPIDLANENKLDAQLKSWMAFATQKCDELQVIANAVNSGDTSAFADSDAVAKDRATSTRIHDQSVQSRLKALTPAMAERNSPFKQRQQIQRDTYHLPLFPTTTIGSFPQTTTIREARAAYKKGTLSEADYVKAMQDDIREVVAYQEQTGIDVPVHGEPERNDMVEYFGEQLSGYCFTQNGWVQSYGSRYVKPPIIYGDVSRPNPMTVEWSAFAQSLTKKPMKGMLTGPITMLFWSFVRDDQPRADTCRQIALAIRDEVVDLEKAGVTIIQIDEPAIREGLPLRRGDWPAYLDWAVESFKLSAAGVKDSTQIHTHMCYSEFNDIIDSIGALDADVISIETSRSQMELLDAFVTYKYPNEIGPGVYDIHSPRIPTVDEMVQLLEKAAKVLQPDQIWVNPDCGLKTRGWAEVKPALANMVEATRILRDRYSDKAAA
jgi:5-methyltetrahydropteroyltriglutamate--homocysteine methyltransferase